MSDVFSWIEAQKRADASLSKMQSQAMRRLALWLTIYGLLCAGIGFKIAGVLA